LRTRNVSAIGRLTVEPAVVVAGTVEADEEGFGVGLAGMVELPAGTGVSVGVGIGDPPIAYT
jgi:hypothetical protein